MNSCAYDGCDCISLLCHGGKAYCKVHFQYLKHGRPLPFTTTSTDTLVVPADGSWSAVSVFAVDEPKKCCDCGETATYWCNKNESKTLYHVCGEHRRGCCEPISAPLKVTGANISSEPITRAKRVPVAPGINGDAFAESLKKMVAGATTDIFAMVVTGSFGENQAYGEELDRIAKGRRQKLQAMASRWGTRMGFDTVKCCPQCQADGVSTLLIPRARYANDSYTNCLQVLVSCKNGHDKLLINDIDPEQFDA